MKLQTIMAAIALCLTALSVHAANVGFQETRVPDTGGPPLVIGVWYPTDATPHDQRLGLFSQSVAASGDVAGERLPLVVMSHGTGGWYGEHIDTALALARAGFVVAAVSHTGDTYDDQSRRVNIPDRPRHVREVIDFMTRAWPDHARIDARHIGLFGFSAGGFTALVAAGGVPDLRTIAGHCLAHAEYFDCRLLASAHVDPATMPIPPASVWIHDPRIRAAVVAAPALGFSFGRQGLKGVTIPIQLWRAEDDQILPNPDYAEAVHASLPRRPDFHLVPNAGHFDFLSPCSEALAHQVPEICASRPGFDRTGFHAQFDASVVEFFQRTLR
jgi:predicted dienelactone hydrolase